MTTNVAIFVEDPGAALFLKDLPKALRDRDAVPFIVAGPFAAPYFAGEAIIDPPASANSRAAASVLRDCAADVLVVGTSENPASLAFDLVHAARACGIPSFGAVDSAPNAEYRFRGATSDPLAHLPDKLLLADRTSEAAYLDLGVPAERIVVCGHPQLHAIAGLRSSWNESDRARHRMRCFPGAPADRPIFLFVSELSVGLGDDPFRRTPDYALPGTSGSDARGDIVAEEFVRAARALPSRPYLVLRLHPKQRLEDEARLAAEFDAVSQAEPPLEVVHAADLVVGMTSILLAEAAILGRPVLSIVPRPEERAWLGDMVDVIPCVWQRDKIPSKLAALSAVSPSAPTIVGELTDPADVMAERIVLAARNLRCAAV